MPVWLNALLVCGAAVAADGPASPPPSGGAGDAAFSLRLVATDPAGGGDATLAPDGNRFVACSKRAGQWDLWSFDLRTSAWTRITDHPADDFEGRWSPDGSRMAFCSTRAGQKDIWVLTLATGAAIRLSPSDDDDEYPSWSPDGQSVVYTGGPWGKRTFSLVPAAGGTPRALPPAPAFYGAAAFEPGGNSLVCHRYDSGSGDLFRLWAVDGATNPLTRGAAW